MPSKEAHNVAGFAGADLEEEMTDLAATLLKDVPIRGRIYTGGRINTGGNCLDELVLKKDVLAALSRSLDPDLAERAEAIATWRVGNEAAALITALLAQNAALRAERDQLQRQYEAREVYDEGYRDGRLAAEAEVEKLRGALAKQIIDRSIARLQALPDYAGRPAWDRIVAEEILAALKGDDYE